MFAAFVNWIQRSVHRSLSRPSDSFLTVCLISEIQKCTKLKEIQVSECKFSFIEDYTCVEIPGFSLITKDSAGCGDGHLYTSLYCLSPLKTTYGNKKVTFISKKY